MSTYLQGSTDFIPQLQPFQPELNFYAGVLATKQGQYDTGLAKIGSIYNSAFNSPMLRSDNLERRDKYFKTIEQQIQKVAGLDLSIDQNVSAAKTLFDPIINDQHIVKDMVYTKGLQNSFERAEQYRNCVDPEKCGGSYWDEGVQALQYAQEEFQRASSDDSLKYSAPEYVPFQNVTQKAIKAAKDAGFNVSYDYKSADGRYNVTDTNGQLLLGPDGQGILPQYLYGLFGNDSNVQKMYSTQAYVQRKNYAKSNAGRFNGSEDMAESEYLHNIMLQTVPKIEKAKSDLTDLRDKANVDKKALEILTKNNPGADVQDAYNQLQNILTNTEPTEQYHEQVSNLINTAPNLNDLKSLRSRVDNVVANANFMNTINSAATEYAMGTSKHELKADPYALAAYNNSLDLSKAKQLKNYDQQIWLQQQSLLGNIDSVDEFGNITASAKNSDLGTKRKVAAEIINNRIPKEELYKLGITRLDKAGMQKAIESGLLNKEEITKVQNFANISKEAEPFQNTYNENSKVRNSAMDQAVGMSKEFVKGMLGSMINSFKNADATEGKDALGIKAKILVDTKNILQGTGIDYNALIRGDIPLDTLNDVVSIKMANTAKEIRTKSASSRVYTDGYNDASLAKLQAANQVAENLSKDINLDVKKAVDNSLAEKTNRVSSGDISENDYKKQLILYNSFLSPVGGMLTPAEAKQRYINNAKNLYKEQDRMFKGSVQRVSPQTQALEDFDSMYIPALKEVNERMTSFNTTTSSPDAGGIDATKGAIQKIYNGNLPLAKDTRAINNMVLDFANNVNSNPLIITGAGLDGANIGSQGNTNDPGKQDLFSKITDKIKTGNTKDLNLITTTQFIPTTFDQSAFSFDSNYDKALYSSPNDKSSFPGEFTKEAVMVKMTIGEEEYRKMYGIKADDPVNESDRSLVIKTVANESGFPQSLNPFLEGIQKTPEEIYMQKAGNSINLDLGHKGTASIQRASDNNLIVHLTVPNFNEDTGQWEMIKDQFAVPNQKLDNSYPIITDKLNAYQAANNYSLKVLSNYARSNNK